MENEDTYKCSLCGKTMKINTAETPICCEKPMDKVPLDICTQPAHPEHARPMEQEDACDEFRAGWKRKSEVMSISSCEVCCVCGEEHGLDDINHVEIKGKEKKICKQCATAIKGFA